MQLRNEQPKHDRVLFWQWENCTVKYSKSMNRYVIVNLSKRLKYYFDWLFISFSHIHSFFLPFSPILTGLFHSRLSTTTHCHFYCFMSMLVFQIITRVQANIYWVRPIIVGVLCVWLLLLLLLINSHIQQIDFGGIKIKTT